MNTQLLLSNNFVSSGWSMLAETAPDATATAPTLWLSADVTVYTDTGLTTPVVSDGDLVAGWKDRSGVGHNFTQGTAGSRPSYRLAVRNGKPVIRFDGVDNLMTNAALLSTYITDTAYTVFAVFKATVLNSAGATTYGNDGLIADTGAYFGLYLKNTPRVSIYNWDGADHAAHQTINTTDFNVIQARHESGNLYISKNGGADSSPTVSGGTDNLGGTMVLGADRLGAIFFDGDLAELIIYNVALSSGDRTGVTNYLRNKYAIS